MNLLTEIYSLVKGEAPALLNEDSGGCARLDLAIEASITKTAEEADNG